MSRCNIGVPLKQVLGSLPSWLEAQDLLALFKEEDYVLWEDLTKGGFNIVLKSTADTKAQLKAWLHAIVQHRNLRNDDALLKKCDRGSFLKAGRETLQQVDTLWTTLVPLLLEKGWDLETTALETVSGTRIDVTSSEKKRA